MDLSLALPEISFILYLLKEVLEDVVCPDFKAHCGIMVFEIELQIYRGRKCTSSISFVLPLVHVFGF